MVGGGSPFAEKKNLRKIHEAATLRCEDRIQSVRESSAPRIRSSLNDVGDALAGVESSHYLPSVAISVGYTNFERE